MRSNQVRERAVGRTAFLVMITVSFDLHPHHSAFESRKPQLAARQITLLKLTIDVRLGGA